MATETASADIQARGAAWQAMLPGTAPSPVVLSLMSDAGNTQSVLQLALYRILKSVARVGMRYGLSVVAVSELLRRAYVDAAEESLGKDGKKIKSSSICALTGLYRKEVVRLQELPAVEAEAIDDRYNRSARVITGWTRDENFQTKTGRPAVLPFDGPASFTELVKKYSGDMTPNAMLAELTRLGSIESTRGNSVKLTNAAYIPAENDLDTLQILGTDTADLIATITHNMDKPADERLFQRKVAYIHIPERHVGEFREFASGESQKLLEKLDRWLSKRDTEKIAEGKPGARLGLGIYQFTEHNENSVNEKPTTEPSSDSDAASAADSKSTKRSRS